ncbi:MAG: pyridoxamine 5'-phosphate oxidase family protein [Chitinophagaceae bacterium]|nr:pyridoxamine 5'-phosphate oxidase family protein [Chitinophagaceae bacterium]
MGDIKNLSDNDAIAKIKQLVSDATTCMFVTHLTQQPLSSRPMAAQQVDEEGNIWFLSSRYSEKNSDIEHDDNVQLFFSNNNQYEYLSVYGKAAIIVDKEKAKELWTPIAKTWFHGGVDDPNLTLIKVHPSDAYYWDTKSNKMISLIKMLAGAVTGTTMDNGVQGKMKV